MGDDPTRQTQATLNPDASKATGEQERSPLSPNKGASQTALSVKQGIPAQGDDKSEEAHREDHASSDVRQTLYGKRGCTDVWCLIIFLAHWGGFLFVTCVGMADGNPKKLYSPRDYAGNYCGVKENWNGGPDLENFEKLTHMQNLSMMVLTNAMTLVCSSAAQSELEGNGVLSTAQMETYMCACCKTPCSTCHSIYDYDDYPTVNEASANTRAKMAELTDTSNVNNLYSVTGANGGQFNNIYGEATTYFYQVCAPDCSVTDWNSTDGTGWRSYTYSPPPDVEWSYAWDQLKSNALVSQEMRDTVASAFTFNALPEDKCPYQAKYCVPMPGTSFKELYAGYCSFQITTQVLDAMGTTADKLNVDEAKDSGFETLGTAMGDVISAWDAFLIVAVLAFACGFIFLILLRFAIKCFVWGSVIGVFLVFLASGAACYIRSGQCKGTSFEDTTANYGSSAVSEISDAASGDTGISSDETLTGDGADYRGQQTKTRGSRTCQRWDSNSPHTQSTGNTYSDVTKYGLVENYCRNPLGAIYIWCYTNDPDTRWELCDPRGVQPWDHNCPTGYEVEDETVRDVLKVVAVILWICCLLWGICVCCLFSRIRLAVALCEVAAQFLYNTPQIILVPIVQAICAILWAVIWAFCASFILSQVADDYVPSGAFKSYREVVGTDEDPGKCNDKWPAGFHYKYEGDLTKDGDSCSGDKGVMASDFVHACWRCTPPRYMFDYRFAYSFFSYLWGNAFLIAVGQCTIAGAVGVWFFTEHGKKSDASSLRTGFRNCYRYHAGSLAFGSFLIALVQFIRYIVYYFKKQAEAQKNAVVVCLLRILGYCLWCFEKCLKFLTKNAFIQVALVGSNFCVSAKKAFFLISRNFIRFGIFSMLGGVINILGIAVIMASTLILGYFILMALHDDISPVLPMLLWAAMSYVVAKIFMTVFHLACDTMMQCFIITEELGLEKAEAGGEFVPGPLRHLIPDKE